MLCHLLYTYHEPSFSLVQKIDLPIPFRDGGDIIPQYLRIVACHYINNFRFFKVPK